MRLQKALLCLTIGSLAAAGSASAATNYRARTQIEGQLLATFHGDPAAGCAATVRCDVESGSIRWTPNGQGQLFLFESDRGRLLFSALNVFDPGEGSIGTLALLERRAADGSRHNCVDARGSSYETLPLGVTGRRTLRFSLEPSSRVYPPQPPLPTHCGGPLPSDMLQGLPTREVSLRTMLRGPTKIDLTGSTEFAAGGLAGTVTSTIEITVAKVRARVQRRHRRGRGGGGGEARRPRRLRSLAVEYRVDRVRGTVPVQVQGDERTCGPLDACGLAGSLTFTPGEPKGEAYLVAYGRASKLGLRRALGLAQGPAPRRVAVYGYIELKRGLGSLVAALDRDGAPACRDSVPLRAGTVQMRVRGGEVRASFGGAGDGFGLDPLATRCPGPLGADLGRGAHLASGRLPLSAFGQKRVTLHLDRGASYVTPGFRVRSQPDLTIELEREND